MPVGSLPDKVSGKGSGLAGRSGSDRDSHLRREHTGRQMRREVKINRPVVPLFDSPCENHYLEVV